MSATEKHFSVQELAALWAVSPDSIRRLFRSRPDVFKLNSPETVSKRGYCVLRIPASVAEKVHTQLRKVAA